MSEKTRFEILHNGAKELIAQGEGVFTWLKDLEQMFNLLPKSMNWRYDDDTSILGITSSETLQEGMQEILDAYLEDCKAQTLAAGWRSEQACEAAVHALNQGWIANLNTLARLSLETAFLSMSRFSNFIKRAKGLNNATTAEKWDSEFKLFDDSNNRVNFGRHPENPGNFPFEADSVFKLMEKSFDYLRREGADDSNLMHLRNVYTDLCEITHPNAEGLQVYWNLEGAEPLFPGAPSYRKLEYTNGISLDRRHLALLNPLYALGFSAHYATEVYYRFSRLQVDVLSKKSGYAKKITITDGARGDKKLL